MKEIPLLSPLPLPLFPPSLPPSVSFLFPSSLSPLDWEITVDQYLGSFILSFLFWCLECCYWAWRHTPVALHWRNSIRKDCKPKAIPYYSQDREGGRERVGERIISTFLSKAFI